MTDVPHFNVPFSYRADGSPDVVEQGTIEDIVACVEAALRTPIGFRKELPDFGAPDLTFETLPIPVQNLLDHILVSEPRAEIVLFSAPDRLDQMIQHIVMNLSSRET